MKEGIVEKYSPRSVLFLSLLAISFFVSGCGLLPTSSGYGGKDAYYCRYVDGYWGQWLKIEAFAPQYIGSPDNFGIGFMTSSPRTYFAKVKVNGFSKSDLKKRGQFYRYNGTIEYWIIDYKKENRYKYDHQSRTFVERFGQVYTNETITRPATISICKGNRRGSIVYNIYFDNVGIGFDIPWN